MIKNIKSDISRNIVNIKGWRTNRKIVVFESDDWGSIRMPSKDVYARFLNKEIRVDKCPYNRNDSLASVEDLEALFNVLILFKDKKGNHPAITANTVVANPDFIKIEQSGFEKYYHEPFTETLKKYPAHQNAFILWKQGMDSKIFYPQFHGREHLNVPLWLSLLQARDEVFMLAFNYRFWGLGKEIIDIGKINLQAAYDTTNSKNLVFQKEAIKEGLQLFEQIFNYQSKSFIANNFIWDISLNEVLKFNEVNVLQGMKYQKLPLFDESKRKLIRHFTGQQNKLGQIYLVRNCTFEPTQFPNIDSVNSCLSDITNAFFWKKPAIINSHRLNFIGFINEENRTRNLVSFKQLLKKIIEKWSDVEFMTSVELGELIMNHKNIKK